MNKKLIVLALISLLVVGCDGIIKCTPEEGCGKCGNGCIPREEAIRTTCNAPTEDFDCVCDSGECKRVEKEVKSGECTSDADCAVGGCSGQLCGPRDKVNNIITTCEYLPIYACYGLTACSCISERCEWKENEAFMQCKAQNSGKSSIPVV